MCLQSGLWGGGVEAEDTDRLGVNSGRQANEKKQSARVSKFCRNR